MSERETETERRPECQKSQDIQSMYGSIPLYISALQSGWTWVDPNPSSTEFSSFCDTLALTCSDRGKSQQEGDLWEEAGVFWHMERKQERCGGEDRGGEMKMPALLSGLWCLTLSYSAGESAAQIRLLRAHVRTHTHTLFKSPPHIFFNAQHSGDLQTFLLKGQKSLMCGAPGGMHHSVAHWKLWTASHNLLKGVFLQDASGLRIVWVDPEKIQKDMNLHTENIILTDLQPTITSKCFWKHIHKLSSKQRKHTHTPNHTITRHNQFSMCKQCYPNTRGWYICQQQPQCETIINKCVLKRLLINAECDQRERERGWTQSLLEI